MKKEKTMKKRIISRFTVLTFALVFATELIACGDAAPESHAAPPRQESYVENYKNPAVQESAPEQPVAPEYETVASKPEHRTMKPIAKPAVKSKTETKSVSTVQERLNRIKKAGEQKQKQEQNQEQNQEQKQKQEQYVAAAFADLNLQTTPSVGEVAWPLFVIDFQNAKYTKAQVSREEMEQWIFTEDTGSVAGFYNTSSHGRVHMSGDVYYYTAKGDIEDYESYSKQEALIMECLDYFDDEVDFSKYDGNGDGVMDALAFSVPRGGDADFWWACRGLWSYNPKYRIDGIELMNFIVSDEQPYQTEKRYYIGTLRHEMGHCMGLPDYYKYNYSGNDFEGLHGIAGKEIMDDSEGDFGQFSKLQLGWLTTAQVQIMPDDAEKMIFQLPPAEEGGCVLIFPKGRKPDFQREYFLVEYVTKEGYYKGSLTDEGVRIMHAQAELMTSDGYYYQYKYNNSSKFYDTSNNGIRVLKLVNDGKGFFHTGDEATFENTGGKKGNMGWYKSDGKITDPEFRIRIGDVQKETGCIEIEVIRE